ncbi:DUF3881 family protein [Lachnobacterium bovis]|uniref:Uncharacterized protein n=1 Tax=Lachnobacterium bovis TaxID=140626 RepID=A0A1H9UC93_9FIRM|nr:DUF3881 family protein [Lachnobacterium bovis]SES07085.1 protein of unknown function [Lachnobacterium bovis]
MNKYLKSIGFSDLNRENLEDLLKRVEKENYYESISFLNDGTRYGELRMQVAPNIGVTVCGYYKEDTSEFVREYYYPFLKGTSKSTNEKIEVERYYDKEALCGICDEIRMGVTLIFFVQNIGNCNTEIREKKISRCTYLAGLAESGTILLPIQKKNNGQVKFKNSIERKNNELISKAREGDEDAVENLMENEINTYSTLTKRIKNEDVLSIVSTTIIPYGVEPDIYNIIGNIKKVKKEINKISKEEIYIMKIDANGIEFDICINSNDLLGEPKVGRRFKGKVWLQGEVYY